MSCRVKTGWTGGVGLLISFHQACLIAGWLYISGTWGAKAFDVSGGVAQLVRAAGS